MTARSGRWFAWCCWALVCAGCASFVSREEYADYRALRLARGDDERLVAMHAYVSRHPGGAWHAEVENERRVRDVATFERGKHTRSGIEFYLRVFPDGVFAAQARARLGAIEAIEARRRAEVRRAEARAVAERAREAELRRTWVTRFLAHWTRTFLGLLRWGAPIEEVARDNPVFSRAFGRAPRPRCTVDECVKYYESRFAVPVPGGTRIERGLQLVLRLRMRGRALVRAELLLPGWGFSRWYELEERRAVVDALPDERERAVAWVRARTEPWLAARPGTWVPELDHVLGLVSAPAIGSTGELIDTTAEDPAAPANRIETAPGEPPAEEPSVPVHELTKPEAPPETPDMVLDPLRVNRDGRPVSRETPAPAVESARTPGAEEVMVLDPMAVPAAVGAAPPAAADEPTAGVPGAASEPTMAASPRVERSFRNGALRVVWFAAGTSERAPAYDGIVIEAVDASAESPRPGADRGIGRRRGDVGPATGRRRP